MVIGMSFCICLPNFVVIGRSAAELLPHIDFRRPWSRKSTSGFRFSDGIYLRRWKSVCMPNFDEISQFTAEMKLLLVSKNGQPPYWHSISGFHFDVCIVIGMSFCIWLPNFVVIRRLSLELMEVEICLHAKFRWNFVNLNNNTFHLCSHQKIIPKIKHMSNRREHRGISLQW